MDNNKPVKICHVANTDKALKFLLLPQLKFLAKEGYDVYAVCSPGKWTKTIEAEGIKVKTIKMKRKISPFSDLAALAGLFLYFRKEKFQIVHVHNPKPGVLGQLAAKMAGVPIIINTVHGLYFHKDSSPLKRKFFIFIEKIAASCSDLIFSQNKEDMDTLVKEKIAKPEIIKYLGNGIDIRKFSAERFSKEFIDKKKKELRIPADYKVVGIVARLVEEKGYLDLFKAFKSVLDIFPDILLLVIGPEEPEKKDVINPKIAENYGIAENTVFLGERDDVDEILALMDIFVLPSYREGFPRSVLEASAMGKPVVATDIRGCKEAVDDGRTGILVPAKNPEKLAQALVYFLKNPAKAEETGKNGRIKVTEEFDETLVFDKIRKEYRSLLDKNAKLPEA